MHVGTWDLEILDPGLFARKLVLLVAFTLGFIPLKYYGLDQILFWYVVVLLVMHVYFLGILIWRVRWKQLAAHKRSFGLRIVAVVFFVYLLTILSKGIELFLLFLAASLVVHVALLLSLTMVVHRHPKPMVGEPVPVRAE